MTYEIYMISSEKELSKCPLFFVDQYNWGGDYRPKTYGKLAYVKEKGFLLHMTCEEENPLCVYQNPEDPVYKDSAMEAFFDFAPETRENRYLNFEANANGALLNHIGKKRPNKRTKVSELTWNRAVCLTNRSEKSWSLTLKIPNAFIHDLYGKSEFYAGDRIRCNFYKICENTLPIEHYGSFTKIETKTCDFHQPDYFADGILADSNCSNSLAGIGFA